MEKILLFQMDETAVSQITKLACDMKIKVISVSEDLYGEPLGLIADQRAAAEKGQGSTALPGSLLVFCGLTERHLDKMLLKIKQENIPVGFKAVLTMTNRDWTVQKLYLELARENAYHRRT